jgi:small subunit ribosomal protein S6
MRQYETAFLITPNLEEEETEKLIEQMAEVVKKKKGKMVNIEKWGKRRLAYPIDKQDEAVYVFFHYQGDPDIPHELLRRFRQTETIIRYLTLKKDEQDLPRKKTKTSRRAKAKSVEVEEKEKRQEEIKKEAEEMTEKTEELPEAIPDIQPEVTKPETDKPSEEK